MFRWIFTNNYLDFAKMKSPSSNSDLSWSFKYFSNGYIR